MRIGDHGRGAARNHRASKLRWRYEAALDVDVGVDEPRGDERAAEIDRLARLVVADADDSRAHDRDVGRLDLAGVHVDDAAVLEQQLGRLVAARETKELLCLHNRRILPSCA